MVIMRKTKLYNLWITIQSSFWFIPSVMILALFCLSFVVLGIDFKLGAKYFLDSEQIVNASLLGKFLTVGPDGARAVLTTIAGSMITVAGVTFSITIVALTLAASQFGPRLLRNFMQDRSTQFVLGAFSSTFVYCLLILRSIHSSYDSYFVPTLSVNLAVIFAIINIGVLIFFIHHISVSLKAEDVIMSVYDGLCNDIDRIFRDITAEDTEESITSDRALKEEKNSQNSSEESITANSSGYVQAIDHEKLMDLSCQHEMVIQLSIKAGDFSVIGSHIATARGQSSIKENVQDAIGNAFIYGSQRTPEQDVEYGIHQLVEIAVRSLSKGINDPFTAISCVDYLSTLLCYLAQKKMPHSHCYDTDGKLRLITKEIAYGNFLDSAFNQLRQNSSSSVAVTIRLMDAFIRIAHCLEDITQKEELHRHVRMLYQEANHCFNEKQDVTDLQKRYDKCISVLGVS